MAALSTDMSASGEHRLAAIVFADVAGYSRLMAVDEPGTHRRWMSFYHDAVEPLAAQHRGRIVERRGDGVLAEFASALDAVEWSRALHEAARGTGEDPVEPLSLHIAIHLGEVYATGDGLFGDAVNLTARLQAHAAAGGTVISEPLRQALRGSLGQGLIDLGLLRFKNDERPMRAFALGPEHVAPQLRQLGLLPSVAVLPLRNLGGDPADEYLAAGIVDDVIQSLSGLRELAVIARGSTVAFAGLEVDPRAVGRDLGARYVLTGTLRRGGGSIRVVTELTDAESGRTLWSDRQDGSAEQIFDLQDRMVQRIVTGVAPNIRASELRASLRKRPESLTAYDHMLRGLHLLYAPDRESLLRARQHVEQAMQEDPGFAQPAAHAAWWHTLWLGQGWAEDPEAEIEKAFRYAGLAIALDPSNALALAIHGHMLSYLRHEYDAALLFFARALDVCPNQAFAWMMSSATLAYVGRAEEALAHAQQGLTLSPHDQSRYLYLNRIAIAHFAAGNYAEAIRWARQCRAENGAHTANLRFLAASLALVRETTEAQAVAQEMLRLEPRFALGEFVRTRQPFRAVAAAEAYVAGLRAAGLPE